MTALFLSFVLLAYIIIPGTIFRRIFNIFVPLRRFQWTRTEELTASVLVTVPPLVVAYILVHFRQWFGHHPLDFPDSVAMKWTDYKDVLSASYSEKFFDENRQPILQALERVIRRQLHFMSWFYLATAAEAALIGYPTRYYGRLRQLEWKWISRIFEKFILPGISEWHVMFTPFTFPRDPERIVQVDALTSDGTLYQGVVGDFHVDASGHLTGFLLKKARRFLRDDYKKDRNQGKPAPSEKYWRAIPGESLYLLADKVSNLNLSYLAAKPLGELAEETLKKYDINDASVAVQSTQITPSKAEVEQPEVPAEAKDFNICPHCVANGRRGYLPRLTLDTPQVSRSDGRTYHLFLQFGPTPRPSITGGIVPNQYLAHFRFDLDALKIQNEPISVLLHVPPEFKNDLLARVEAVADELAQILNDGRRPLTFYENERGKLTALKVIKTRPKRPKQK